MDAPLDMDALKEDLGAAPPIAGEYPAEDGAASGDHYGALFDALQSNDREAGKTALKDCLAELKR